MNCISKPKKMPAAVCELSLTAKTKTEDMRSWGIDRLVKKLILQEDKGEKQGSGC